LTESQGFIKYCVPALLITPNNQKRKNPTL
jgi:hypothetical protein